MTYFVYSTHQTREAAEAALVDYLAAGIVSESERPHVTRWAYTRTWCVMFPI